METLNNRLNKISNKRAELDAEANNKQTKERVIVAMYEEKIKALAPRIKELLTICAALIKSDISIGQRKKAFIGYKDEFVTDGIDHNLGFFLTYSKGLKTLIGIGIEGGGCCGRDLAVNEDGYMVENPIKHPDGIYNSAYFDYCRKCKLFLDNFDDFEKRVLEYIDNL